MTGAKHENERPSLLDGWLREEDGCRVLRLEEPVSLGRTAEPVTQIKFARLRAKHLRSFKSQDMAGLLGLVEAATSESPRVIDMLSIADALRAIEVVQLDFPDGPPSGGPT